MNRRDAMKMAGSALLAAALAAYGKSKPQHVLILGGTGFIGPHFVQALTAAGHKVTLFNRGKRDPEVKQGVEQLLGDRNGQLDALKGRDWDVVIDNSGYTPKQVGATAGLLRGTSSSTYSFPASPYMQISGRPASTKTTHWPCSRDPIWIT